MYTYVRQRNEKHMFVGQRSDENRGTVPMHMLERGKYRDPGRCACACSLVCARFVTLDCCS